MSRETALLSGESSNPRRKLAVARELYGSGDGGQPGGDGTQQRSGSRRGSTHVFSLGRYNTCSGDMMAGSNHVLARMAGSSHEPLGVDAPGKART